MNLDVIMAYFVLLWAVILLVLGTAAYVRDRWW